MLISLHISIKNSFALSILGICEKITLQEIKKGLCLFPKYLFPDFAIFLLSKRHSSSSLVHLNQILHGQKNALPMHNDLSQNKNQNHNLKLFCMLNFFFFLSNNVFFFFFFRITLLYFIKIMIILSWNRMYEEILSLN